MRGSELGLVIQKRCVTLEILVCVTSKAKPTTQGWVFPIAKIYIPLHYVCRLVFYKQPCLYVETFMNRDCNPV